jgi:redox-sensitive bicupin YhaK (pirin superfamily)
VTNLEEKPALLDCDAVSNGGVVEVLEAREVPLGGPRAMSVRRTLPQRRRSLIGAWCFLDSYGPDEVATAGGMRVPGHPHTGLQTVTWLFEGEVEHRDTAGTVRVVRPGEVNLMTAGSGIAHSEYSTPATTRIHGAQLWLALPESARHGARAFESFAAPQFGVGPALLRVFLGELEGARSPVTTWTPVVGAEILLPAGETVTLTVSPAFEHGLLVDGGEAALDGTIGVPGSLLYRSAGSDRLQVRAGDSDVRLILLGGEPFGESIVMWWNFVGRSHDDIVRYREEWQAQLGRLADGRRDGSDPFGEFPETWETVLPAPELPTVRLRPREAAVDSRRAGT